MIDREQTITILNRLGTTNAEAVTAMNVLLDFLNSHGYNDVAEAWVTAMDRTNKITAASLSATVKSAATNRTFTARSSHDRT